MLDDFRGTIDELHKLIEDVANELESFCAAGMPETYSFEPLIARLRAASPYTRTPVNPDDKGPFVRVTYEDRSTIIRTIRIPLSAVRSMGYSYAKSVERAFDGATGVDPVCIVSYSPDPDEEHHDAR